MRRPILAANWKMNKTVAEAIPLVEAMRGDLQALSSVDRVVCPPYMAIPDVARLLAGTGVGIGAQDLFSKPSGAYTGEVSAGMVREFCDYVIIGHSERRQYFGETDASVNEKVIAALACGLTPIVCVGETLALRQQGEAESWVASQVTAALAGLSESQIATLVIAYEPIWAIGTGLAATADEAQRMCGDVVRAQVARVCGGDVAATTRIQYGGSVRASNTLEIMQQPDIDGALVGGASLVAAEFCAIVRYSAQAKGLL
jgi:triosephosphate isomerase